MSASGETRWIRITAISVAVCTIAIAIFATPDAGACSEISSGWRCAREWLQAIGAIVALPIGVLTIIVARAQVQASYALTRFEALPIVTKRIQDLKQLALQVIYIGNDIERLEVLYKGVAEDIMAHELRSNFISFAQIGVAAADRIRAGVVDAQKLGLDLIDNDIEAIFNRFVAANLNLDMVSAPALRLMRSFTEAARSPKAFSTVGEAAANIEAAPEAFRAAAAGCRVTLETFREIEDEIRNLIVQAKQVRMMYLVEVDLAVVQNRPPTL